MGKYTGPHRGCWQFDERGIGGVVGAGMQALWTGDNEGSAENSSLSRTPNSEGEREGVLAEEVSLRTATSNAVVNGTLNSIFRLCVARIRKYC